MKISNVLIGADIELFLRNKNTKEIVTAEGIAKGTKDEPFCFDDSNKFFATSLDNVLYEFGLPPCNTAGDYYKAIQHSIRYINSVLPLDLETIALPAARLDERFLQTENAKRFGCSPSTNCWTQQPVYPQPTGDNLRSAGFHIHYSYDEPNNEISLNISKAMDLFLGVPSIIIEPENERKAVGYGCAGNMRLKNYGGEYRTLSSYFTGSQALSEWCFNNTHKAIEFLNNGGIESIINLGDDIQDCINNSNKEMAKQFIDNFNIALV